MASRRRTAYVGGFWLERVQQPEIDPGRERRFVFDEVADLYARARTNYPAELIEDVIRETGL